MSSTEHALCFTPFKQDISDLSLPERFTYPFCYQPHSLSIAATKQLTAELDQFHPLASAKKGRMYGVLVVQKPSGELGYLSALSGKHDDDVKNDALINFVPPVFDTDKDDPYFVEQQAIVNRINQEINELQSCLAFKIAESTVTSEQAAAQFQISRLQNQHVQNRKSRKAQRQQLALKQENEASKQASIQLSRESVEDKRAISALKAYWQQRTQTAQAAFNKWQLQLAKLQKTRRKLSATLQKRLFKQYQLLNQQGECKNLIELFAETVTPTPPAGSGDCAAPKLLQYAFKNQLTPICMAEFWWGKQPESEIRKHQHFYPACQGKCLPILTHMLEGIALDDNPLLANPAAEKLLDIVYQDEHLVVVNKPEGMLSVPGKTIEDSAATRIQALFPEATGSMVLHRLDMATSGLLVFALTQRAHKHLQKQFINKVVQKRYIALIDGEVDHTDGEITLPLMLDINDRPRQKVCFEHGKPAQTQWQLISHENGKSRLWLHPISGRTHQLRVHCAHHLGLNMPIIGDDLYGTSAERLHLHAQRLSFLHPITQQRVSFEVDANF